MVLFLGSFIWRLISYRRAVQALVYIIGRFEVATPICILIHKCELDPVLKRFLNKGLTFNTKICLGFLRNLFVMFK